ncbi:craniofacial development protein 1 isoform X1 [Crocuta crocuta]
MEEFDSEDFSTSEEDEDYVPSGGEYSEDDVNELVKEDEVDGEEQTQKTKGKKRKAQSIPARKRKQGGLSLEEEDEEDANEDSEGSSSEEEEDAAAEQEKGIGADDARKKKEDELWASFLNDVGPKPKVPPNTQVKSGEKTEETGSSKLLVRPEELEKPKETEKVKITKVFDFAGEEVRVTKEVDATSKEAKSFFKQNEKEKPQAAGPAAVPPLPVGSGQEDVLCLRCCRSRPQGLATLPSHAMPTHPGVEGGRGQRSNKSSENKYKETKGTKKETDMRNVERNQTSREHVHVFRVIFCSIFREGTGTLAVLLCIISVFSFF